MAVSDCANTLLSARATAAARRQLDASLALTGQPGRLGLPVPPGTAYAALFGERLDPYLAGRLDWLYADALLRVAGLVGEPPAQPTGGSVYVFYDARDPVSVVKIGRSNRPARRLRQWRAELGLGTDPGGVLTALFTVGTLHAPLAEAVLHTVLWCRQCTARINRRTGRQLVEYFDVPDRAALRTLCTAVAGHVDAAVAAAART